MSLLSDLKSNEKIEDEADTVGAAFLVDSGVYNMMIDMAYIDKSSGGAVSLNIHFKNEKAIIRQTIYITSGDAKGNKSTYTDSEGNTKYLPGYNIANAISVLTINKEISELETEEKIVKRYDPTQGKEIPQKTNVLVELMNQPITVGLIKLIENKNVKNSQGVYVPNGETRTSNEIGKLFRASDGLTLKEIRDGVTISVFRDEWSDKWTGRVKDKSTKSSTQTTTTGAPVTNKPANSLFSN